MVEDMRNILNVVAMGLQLMNEVINSSSSSENSEDEEFEALHGLGRKTVIPRVENYAEHVIPALSNQEFKSHFRSICERFNVGRSTALYITRRVTRAVNEFHVGSVHDQRVFRLSEVYGYLGDAEKFPEDSHLIGDSAYKLHENLLVPYRDNGHLTERQRNYNFCHSSARMAIERSFGTLKGRFCSLLTVLPMRKIDSIPAHIIACLVLHNICSFRGDDLLITLNEGDADNIPRNVNMRHDVAQVGVAKRDLICQRLLIRDA
ncbi:hypothetical protein NQ315_008974 [Exocentrus adspersus]|uniref:DDE Tnp4 domain-containing protein n=1 Tax=Exocentrus adspersus TaxID=1586481 RepID=A0AAV8VI23_9CUCU|nr:hypothetical protein NQ315_008974 [Exocentrus adspersus]